MDKKIIWLGTQEDKHLLPILQQEGYTIQFLTHARQCRSLHSPVDCLICCGTETKIQSKDLAAGLPIVLYEPRRFTHNMRGRDVQFALAAEMARRAEAVICCDEASSQWWSCFNSNVYLLSETRNISAPSALEVRIAEMIVGDYLAGCSYRERHRFELWGKVRRYYKKFGLWQTLRRVYEKLTGSEN